MFSLAGTKRGSLVIGAITGALGITLAVAFLFFGMRGRDLGLVALYLFLSGSISLAFGLGAIHIGIRSSLNIRYKMATAGAAGSAAAPVNVMVTALLMFLSHHDLTLLMVLLVFPLTISLFLAFLLAGPMTSSMQTLRRGAQRLAEGDLATRLEVTSRDEIADLAVALNIMTEELDNAFRRQRDMEQARRDLIASLSHDLRTPLTSMRAMVEAITDDVVSDPATLQRYFSNLNREVEHISTLIDDPFEISRLDTGTLELQLRPSSVGEILANALDSMEARAHMKALNLRSELEGELGQMVVDPHKIQRVLYNLIQNAIRHTPADGTIVVKAQDLGLAVQIDVTDTGQGIAQEELDKVFDRLYRGEKSRSREYGGSGLGLAIAKGIIEAHGGDIWVESSLGNGSRFSFPCPEGAPTAPPRKRPSHPLPPFFEHIGREIPLPIAHHCENELTWR